MIIKTENFFVVWNFLDNSYLMLQTKTLKSAKNTQSFKIGKNYTQNKKDGGNNKKARRNIDTEKSSIIDVM